jgi:hypothetical protein
MHAQSVEYSHSTCDVQPEDIGGWKMDDALNHEYSYPRAFGSAINMEDDSGGRLYCLNARMQVMPTVVV